MATNEEIEPPAPIWETVSLGVDILVQESAGLLELNPRLSFWRRV